MSAPTALQGFDIETISASLDATDMRSYRGCCHRLKRIG